MLMNMKELLFVANEYKFAVGAFNITDSILFKAVIDEAEANNSPVIVELAPVEFDYATEEFFEYVVKRLSNSPIPAVLHLDHGRTLEDCMKAIRCGFTSVMIDGSMLSYEENISLTSEVVSIAHTVNVSVEGEIGTIGTTGNSHEGGVKNIEYTKPEEVVDFANRTNVDTLAIAIGTAHGIYPEGMVPKLRLDLLRKIAEISPIPLVLHGGSSNADEEIREACKNGINKVNIASDYRKAFFEGVTATLVEDKEFWGPRVYKRGTEEARKVIKHKMELFGSVGKATLYK